MSNVVTTGKGGLLDRLLTGPESSTEKIDRLYLSLLNRPASSAEREKFAAYVADGKPEERWREAIWALMTSSEFRFNH